MIVVGNGATQDHFLKSRFVIFRCQKYVKIGYIEMTTKIYLATFKKCPRSLHFSLPCWTFNNMINAVPVFRLFEIKAMDHLPRVYISDSFALQKQRNSEEIFVNMLSIIRSYCSMSKLVLKLKRIINSLKWNTAWISSFAEAFRWYIIKNIIWKSKKT